MGAFGRGGEGEGGDEGEDCDYSAEWDGFGAVFDYGEAGVVSCWGLV